MDEEATADADADARWGRCEGWVGGGEWMTTNAWQNQNDDGVMAANKRKPATAAAAAACVDRRTMMIFMLLVYQRRRMEPSEQGVVIDGGRWPGLPPKRFLIFPRTISYVVRYLTVSYNTLGRDRRGPVCKIRRDIHTIR